MYTYTWYNALTDAPPLAGVKLLVVRLYEHSCRLFLATWLSHCVTTSRNVSIAVASLHRLQYNLRARAFREWDAFVVCERRKKRGAALMGTRSRNAHVHECILYWRGAAAQCVHGRASAERLRLITCAQTLARACKEWAGEKMRLRAIRDRLVPTLEGPSIGETR